MQVPGIDLEKEQDNEINRKLSHKGNKMIQILKSDLEKVSDIRGYM
jgi:hypothetical protein